MIGTEDESAQLVQLGQAERMLAEVASVEDALNLVDYEPSAAPLKKYPTQQWQTPW